MNKDSNFYTVYICTLWIRFGFYIFLVDYFLMGLSYFYFKLNISLYYYIAQAIPGTIFFFYMEYSMISSYKARKRTYLFIRKLLKENKEPKYSLLYSMGGSLCELACIHSLEREFKKKLL